MIFYITKSKNAVMRLRKKEYHSTAKFLKNVALLKFASVFHTEQENGE